MKSSSSEGSAANPASLFFFFFAVLLLSLAGGGAGDPTPNPVPPGPGGQQADAERERIREKHTARNMAHRFGGSGKGGKLDIQHEKEHMKAHGHGQVEAWVDLDSMDEPRLMATYFRNFDLDKNGRIDGLELLKSMQKMNEEHKHDDDDA